MIKAALSRAEELTKEHAVKLVSAILVGYLSGFMIYFLLWPLFLNSWSPVPSYYLFIAAWIVSSCGVYIRADSVATIFARGALIGVAEWLAAGLAGVLIRAKIGVGTTPEMMSGAERTGTELDPVVSMVAIGGSFSMAIFCLLIWFLANKTKPEFQQRLYS